MNYFQYVMIKNLVVLLGLILQFHIIECQYDESDGPYRGKLINTFNSYHHEIGGTVYAVDEYTIFISNFKYDGTGTDTFFWAGASARPGPIGFLVPNEYGYTNILERYVNKDLTLKLPDNKKITDIKWLAIYDLNTLNDFADVYIDEKFEPPRPQKGGSFSKKSHGVRSGNIEVLDSRTIKIPDFYYDGKSENAFFMVGVGPQPSRTGSKIPDELGYVDPIRNYEGETITLELPGELTIFQIDWISVFDMKTNENFGSVLIANDLNVPPSLTTIHSQKPQLPNCRQLHKDFRVSWEVFGPAITIELSGQVKENEYMSFGISGSDTSSQMLGSDVVVAYIDGARGYAIDYNITSLAPCVQVLGQNKGVCRDEVVGGLESYQVHSYSRVNNVNTITFRRDLISADTGDKVFRLDKETYIVWAIGQMDSNNEPAFHDIYPKKNFIFDFNATVNDCFNFTKSQNDNLMPWTKSQIVDRSVRTFTATLGPAGGRKGYSGITEHVSNGLAWYLNGYLIPELWLRRGLTYYFRVRGGNNPHSPEYYHPLVITDEQRGGFDRLTEAKQNEIRVLAGVEFTRRGRPKPTAAGPLCLGTHPVGKDRRLDDQYATFKKFNRSLEWKCDDGEPALLEITPNSSWPDTVYYNSFTHANMGWKIHIIDSFSRKAYTSKSTVGETLFTRNSTKQRLRISNNLTDIDADFFKSTTTEPPLNLNVANGPYHGKYINKFSMYAHEISGDVYAVDDTTFYISDFRYDGRGTDTFFWAGGSDRPSPIGFIIPNEYGYTNILERYQNKDFTLTLPDNKKISDIKWLSVFDLNTQKNYADVYFPPTFQPPKPQLIGNFVKNLNGIRSGPIEVINSKTIKIPEFYYNGISDSAYFFVGIGKKPTIRGTKIPDELGYIDAIRMYNGETITLELPGFLTIFNIDWISVTDVNTNITLGYFLIPKDLNVPPSLIETEEVIPHLPNCKQLHKNLRIAWEVFGFAITFEISGQIEESEYMSFGISGSETSSQMLGSDIMIGYLDGARSYASDYNVAALSPCVQVLGQHKGVCRDDLIGGLDSYQVHSHTRLNGITTITYRRDLMSGDSGDKEFRLDKASYVVWAIGRLDTNNEPGFHDIYPKRNVLINFNDTINDCFNFTKSKVESVEPWPSKQIINRIFVATVGPDGGKRGYSGITGRVSSGLAWYLNGYLIPELWLRRGLTYAFKVYGGNNPHSAEYYHPFIITDEPQGGYDRLTDLKQSKIRVLAGVEFSLRGRPKPKAAGALCFGKQQSDKDRRLNDKIETFHRFNRTLEWKCESGDPATLEITPDNSWPDIVYYHSFTQSNMGWKIHIVDSYSKENNG